jgi:phosphoenolpyruvate carboxylase
MGRYRVAEIRARQSPAGPTREARPIRFSSWVGGDRDGNPNVTPEVTRRATLMARWVAAYLFAKDVDRLVALLSFERGRAGQPKTAHDYCRHRARHRKMPTPVGRTIEAPVGISRRAADHCLPVELAASATSRS